MSKSHHFSLRCCKSTCKKAMMVEISFLHFLRSPRNYRVIKFRITVRSVMSHFFIKIFESLAQTTRASKSFAVSITRNERLLLLPRCWENAIRRTSVKHGSAFSRVVKCSGTLWSEQEWKGWAGGSIYAQLSYRFFFATTAQNWIKKNASFDSEWEQPLSVHDEYAGLTIPENSWSPGPGRSRSHGHRCVKD